MCDEKESARARSGCDSFRSLRIAAERLGLLVSMTSRSPVSSDHLLCVLNLHAREKRGKRNVEKSYAHVDGPRSRLIAGSESGRTLITRQASHNDSTES